MRKREAIQRIGLGLMLAAALFAAPACFAQATNQTDSLTAATDAYAAMVQADESRDNEDWAGAISGYRDALGLYRRLAVGQPDWEPETVQYRITYCANQLEKIGWMTGQSASELFTNSTPDEIAKRKPDTEDLKTRLAAVPPPDAGAQTNELAAREVLQHMHEGLAQERSGNFAGALGIYEQVLSARPSYVEALKARGRCLLQQGQFDEAVAILRGVAFANRDDAQSRLLLGTAYCLSGKYNPAVEVLTPLVAMNDPSNARAQNAIGASWMGLGDTRSAKIALEKAISLDPELADAHFNLAQVLLATGPANEDKARDHYRKAMALGAQADEELAKALGSP